MSATRRLLRTREQAARRQSRAAALQTERKRAILELAGEIRSKIVMTGTVEVSDATARQTGVDVPDLAARLDLVATRGEKGWARAQAAS